MFFARYVVLIFFLFSLFSLPFFLFGAQSKKYKVGSSEIRKFIVFSEFDGTWKWVIKAARRRGREGEEERGERRPREEKRRRPTSVAVEKNEKTSQCN